MGGVVNVTQWHGCYSDSWQGVITPDAFAHPAKYARGLIWRIYQHMLDSGYVARGDSIIDPFGGVALGGLDAMTFGLHWTGCELEPRFVELGNRNIDKWRRDLAMLNGTLGTARLLQGDSRRLAEVVGAGMAAAVSSPPFENQLPSHDDFQPPHDTGARLAVNFDTAYGSTPGQLGAMPSGDYGAAVSSPPFSGDKNLMAVNDQGVRSDMVARRGMVESDTQQSPGNLAALRADSAGFTAAVSSPPYADNAATWVEGPGARHDPIHHNGDNAFKASSDNGYGSTPGNVGNMRDGGFEGVVSSPPFMENAHPKQELGGKNLQIRDNPRTPGEKLYFTEYVTPDSPGQLGTESPDTFWTAARAIVEQTYAALRPGGYAAWVTKCFVRKGAIVPFSDQWEQLCAAVGFEPVERIAAMLVDDHGDQLDIFGGATARLKERKSFFRRLAEKKGSPRIDHEDVIIMRKPTRAHANGNGARSEP